MSSLCLIDKIVRHLQAVNHGAIDSTPTTLPTPALLGSWSLPLKIVGSSIS
jgi:hypothetical protein